MQATSRIEPPPNCDTNREYDREPRKLSGQADHANGSGDFFGQTAVWPKSGSNPVAFLVMGLK